MILIKNGRIIDPHSKRDEVVDIVIRDNKILKIGKCSLTDEYEKVIDASGCIVAPGLIDVHVHFRDPGFTHKEDIETGSKSAAKGGFTTVVCMANTNPIVDNEETLEYIKEKAKTSPINVLQACAITKGFKGKELVDMKYLKECGAVGFTDDGLPIMDSDVIYNAMLKAKELDVPLSFHEEDPFLITVAGINEGEISKKLGISGASNVAEDVMVARDCMIAIKTGAKVNIQHISSGVSVETVRMAKKLGANVYAEATPHHFTLSEKDVLKHKTLAKMNPPLRAREDMEALIKGLSDDIMDVISTDHAPHSAEEKAKDLEHAPFGIVGLETSVALTITNLVKKGHITPLQMAAKMSYNPAKVLGSNKGTLNENAVADVVVINPDTEYEIDANTFASKGKNTPFNGYKVNGQVEFTILGGKIVYENK